MRISFLSTSIHGSVLTQKFQTFTLTNRARASRVNLIYSGLKMKQDLLSMISKSKASKPLKLGQESLTLLNSSPLSSASSLSKTHQISIVDEYLIKIHPSAKTVLESTAITAFDLDGTLINTKSGSKFSRGPNDWKWFNNNVVSALKAIPTPIVIFTNQGAVIAQKTSRSYINFSGKLKLILETLEDEGVDMGKVWVYASPKKGAKYKGPHEDKFTEMRKPRLGMFECLELDLKTAVDKDKSVYVGDAAGRKGDFSDSDKQFAINCGVKFLTPEEYFV